MRSQQKEAGLAFAPISIRITQISVTKKKRSLKGRSGNETKEEEKNVILCPLPSLRYPRQWRKR